MAAVSNAPNNTPDSQALGDPTFTDDQIRQFTLRGARPRPPRQRRPSAHQNNARSFRHPNGGAEHPPAEPQPSTSSQETSGELFGPSFLQGFFVNCSACRQQNKASAKCYECNDYLCEKCVYAHSKGRNTSFHHIYQFDSLAERLSPTVTGVLTPTSALQEEASGDQSSSVNGNEEAPINNVRDEDGAAQAEAEFNNRPRSRVVGAERNRSNGSSEDSSRTSSITIPSPQDSSRESSDGITPVQAVINSISFSMSSSRSSVVFSPISSRQSYYSSNESPTPRNSTTAANQGAAASQAANMSLVPLGRNDVTPPNPEAAAPDNGEPTEAAVAASELELPPCRQHFAKYNFFCTDCMIPVCYLCLQEKHMAGAPRPIVTSLLNASKDHSLLYITEALHKGPQISQELNRLIRGRNGELRQTLDALQRMSECVDYRAHQVAIDVRCTIRRFISALEARQDDILHRIEQARQVKLKMLCTQMENIRHYYSRLSRARDIVSNPTLHVRPLENMAVNFQVFLELKQANNLGENIYPCEDDGFMFMPPNDSQLQSIAFMGHLHVSSGPISNSVALCRQPLLYLSCSVSIPDYPLPAAKSRPIFGCKEVVAIKDFGRMPKMIWGKAGIEDGELCRPWGITINRFGQFVVADRSNNRIQVFNTDGKYQFHFGTHGCRNGQFDRPTAVAINPHDDMVVVDKDNHRVQVFNRNGEFLFTFGERGSQIGQFMYPWDVACDSMGNILVSDARNHRIQLFRWNGIFIAKWGGDLRVPRLFDTPRGVTFDPTGNILMTDFNLHRVVMIERLTGKIRIIGRDGRERGQFNRPQGICCDDRGWFVVTDSRNYRYQVFNENGEFMWMGGKNGKEEPGEFDRPCDVCVDPEGHIHVLDFGNNRIQVF